MVFRLAWLTAICAAFIVPGAVHGEFTLAPRNAALVSAEANSLEYLKMSRVGIIVSGYIVGGLLFHSAVRYRIPLVDVTCLLLTGSWLGNTMPFRAWPSKYATANTTP